VPGWRRDDYEDGSDDEPKVLRQTVIILDVKWCLFNEESRNRSMSSEIADILHKAPGWKLVGPTRTLMGVQKAWRRVVEDNDPSDL
jgi:hypothetical protein